MDVSRELTLSPANSVRAGRERARTLLLSKRRDEHSGRAGRGGAEATSAGYQSVAVHDRANEASNLAESLGRVFALVDEAVVVDTGSVDSTEEVARGLGARVYTFDWSDDFAAARNESLRHARGDWIIWFDADDRIDSVNYERLRALLAKVRSSPDGLTTGYLMRCLSSGTGLAQFGSRRP
jgi:Glycosyl transferase family 2